MLTDALAMGPDNRGHQLGASAPHLLLRSVVCTHGAVELDVEYAPRPEYGIVVPLLSHVDDGVTARGGAEWLVLSTPVPMELAGSTGRARLVLREGDTVRFALHRSTLEEQPAHVWTQDEIAARLASTIASWEP